MSQQTFATPTLAADSRRRRAADVRKRREALTALLLIAPAFALFLGFVAGPLVGSMVLSGVLASYAVHALEVISEQESDEETAEIVIEGEAS